MRIVLVAIMGIILWMATPAGAHQLDEYLEATTLSVEADHVSLCVRLTPGVAVAGKVLAELDADGNGSLSETERQAYAERVRRDLVLKVDDRPMQLELVSQTFASVDEMKAGLGEIVLNFRAAIPRAGTTARVVFENRHEAGIGAYLVNTLVPRDPTVRIVGQSRSYDQASYEVDLASGAAQEGAGAVSACAADGGGMFAVVETYFFHGVYHILTGYDHLLFVSALVLGSNT